jgi:hypothetical protein
MNEERAHLAQQLPNLVRDLVRPPDADGDGRRDWQRIEDLHLGVITTSVADRADDAPCDETDDAVLRTRPAEELDGCADRYPPVLTYRAGADDPGRVSQDFACLARVPSGRCGVEQPLEAALKALSPSDTDLAFRAGTGRGDGTNAGFLRPDSVLALVVITDEDDCSYRSPEFFLDPDRLSEALPPCLAEEDPLWPLERYEQGLAALRPEHPERLIFAVIAGMPAEFVSDPSAVDFEALLNDGRMHPEANLPASRSQVLPACEGSRGSADPARRLVRMAKRFGDRSVLGSICQRSYTPVVGAIAQQVGTRACETR